MRGGNIAGVYVMNKPSGEQYAVSSVWLLLPRAAGWAQVAIPEALSATVGASFLRSFLKECLLSRQRSSERSTILWAVAGFST
jgi:hypothetical protein